MLYFLYLFASVRLSRIFFAILEVLLIIVFKILKMSVALSCDTDLKPAFMEDYVRHLKNIFTRCSLKLPL